MRRGLFVAVDPGDCAIDIERKQCSALMRTPIHDQTPLREFAVFGLAGYSAALA